MEGGGGGGGGGLICKPKWKGGGIREIHFAIWRPASPGSMGGRVGEGGGEGRELEKPVSMFLLAHNHPHYRIS